MVQPHQQHQQTVQALIGSSIITTATLANAFCIACKGEFTLPAPDYLQAVADFQASIAKRIMPIKTQGELEEAAQVFMNEVYKLLKEQSDATRPDDSTDTTGTPDQGEGVGEGTIG